MKTNIHFLSYLAEFFLEREKFQTKVVQKIKTHILRSVNSVRKSTFYEIMWKNKVKPDGPQMKIYWITKVTNRHSEYVALIAFPLPQWQYENVSILRYKYISCLPVLYVCL